MKRHLPEAQKVNRPTTKSIKNPEIQNILDDIRGSKTSHLDRSRGQAFAQVRDPLPQETFRLDNEAVRSLKKKRVRAR
jgi:hypothetical protein